MPRLFRNAVIILAVLIIAAISIWPPKDKLRRGKDLAGGVTLTYAVQVGPGEDRRSVLDRTIDTIKRRIDPNGVMDISIVPQGADRLEISMPLPSDELKAKRAKFEQELADLGRSPINPARLDRVMEQTPADRSRQIEALGDNDVARLGLLKGASEAYDTLAALRREYQGLTDQAAREAKAGEVADAEIAYEKARQDVLRTVVTAAEMRRLLQLSRAERSLTDPTGKLVSIPSPRAQEMARLIAERPGAKAEIERLVSLADDYTQSRTTLDDPYDLVRLLKQAGVLSFRISVGVDRHPEEARLRQELRERGPSGVRSNDAKWCRINDLAKWYDSFAEFEAVNADAVGYFRSRGYVVDAHGGEHYMLCWDTRTTRLTQAEGDDWQVAGSSPSRDEIGRNAIAFTMNAKGARLLGGLTREHVGSQMAVLLDDQVYTAPTLQSAIAKNGQITGSFTPSEVDYIVRVLNAGSLQAKLSPEPLSIDSIGPELGTDNLRKGLKAGLIALVVTAGFMIVYYFGAGLVAVLGLAVTGTLVLGAMSLQHAAFTMAGIAGVILTFGMAVDANVLIYERMREEMAGGADLRTAVRQGFGKALSSIVDGNITTLIVCVVLANKQLSTPEIRGFGITMGVGVLATLFSGLFFTRFLFDVLVGKLGWRRLDMLPTAVPLLQRVLTPSINWMGKRWVFVTISTILVSLGVVMAVQRGPKMLDTQFLGGTAVTIDLKPGPDGVERLTMKRSEVEERVRAVGAGQPATNPIAQLASANVTLINPKGDGTIASTFRITTRALDQSAIVDAVITEFSDVVNVPPVLEFKGSQAQAARAPVYPIDRAGTFGDVLARPGLSIPVPGTLIGGAAIVLEDISPARPIDSIRARLEKARMASDYSDTLSRLREVFILDGDERAVKSLIIAVRDESISLFDEPERHNVEVRQREWDLVRSALATPVTPASVQSIGATVANDFVARAVAATLVSFLGIALYIWIRFKSFSYSFAAIVALLHDVLSVLGMLALAGWLAESPSTRDWADRLGLMPFKLDLNLVAAMLTVAGYSLNDTVIVMDRIREYRGKMKYASRDTINSAINHTISRTIMTSGTTLLSALVLYLFGGEGVRAFSFALLVGIGVGTYSSVAVASPLVWSRKADRELAEASTELAARPA